MTELSFKPEDALKQVRVKADYAVRQIEFKDKDEKVVNQKAFRDTGSWHEYSLKDGEVFTGIYGNVSNGSYITNFGFLIGKFE